MITLVVVYCVSVVLHFFLFLALFANKVKEEGYYNVIMTCFFGGVFFPLTWLVIIVRFWIDFWKDKKC